MERRTCTEKDTCKKWSWKEDDPEKVKILAGGEILEIGEYPGNHRAVWKQKTRDAQGPWPVTSRMGNNEQQHRRNRPDILKIFMGQQQLTCGEGMVRPREHSTAGERVTECVR